MWHKKNKFPALARLKNFKFDAQKLTEDLKEIASNKQFDGLMAEYSGLCKTHNKLPDFFLKQGEIPNETASYSQLALSAWDESYSLETRQETSGTLWDYTHPKKNKIADERFYRKKAFELPEYLDSVLQEFRPYLHRCRFAKLKAQSEVLPHVDYDTTYGIRLHIAIETNNECTNGAFLKNGDTVSEHIPADGSVWFVNQGLKHWAKNMGTTDRTHLILSIDSQKFIEDLQLSEV